MRAECQEARIKCVAEVFQEGNIGRSGMIIRDGGCNLREERFGLSFYTYGIDMQMTGS